jgi:hypothetical protein
MVGAASERELPRVWLRIALAAIRLNLPAVRLDGARYIHEVF